MMNKNTKDKIAPEGRKMKIKSFAIRFILTALIALFSKVTISIVADETLTINLGEVLQWIIKTL